MRIACSLILLLSTLGCARMSGMVPEFVPPPVLADAEAGSGVYALHEVTFSYGQRSFTFLGQAEWGDQALRLAGVTPTGTRLFLLEYSGDGLVFEKNPLFDVPIKGRYVLRDFQHIFWPADVLRESGFSVDEPEHGRRVVRYKKRVLMEVEYRGDGALPQAVDAQHRRPGYRIALDLKDLAPYQEE